MQAVGCQRAVCDTDQAAALAAECQICWWPVEYTNEILTSQELAFVPK
jgi:hypothetical protein